MLLKFKKSFLLGVIVVVTSANVMAQTKNDPLAPIVACVQAGRFGVLQLDRLPPEGASRTVETAAGLKRVVSIDGYRLILATSQAKPFVNLKIELSMPSLAAADREAVVEQMQAMSAKRTSDQKELQRTVSSGVEVFALHQTNLERRGPLSFYTMLFPANSVIATLYVLNQDQATRVFSTFSEYEVLRDEVANMVQACLVKVDPD